MASEGTCTWTGASGKQYTYHVYPRGTNITEGQDGNYIYAKLSDDGWLPIYFGEGDLCSRAGDDHHKTKCIDSKSATHVHMRLNSTKEARRAEEKDLLANYTNALTPTGCNVSPTG